MEEQPGRFTNAADRLGIQRPAHLELHGNEPAANRTSGRAGGPPGSRWVPRFADAVVVSPESRPTRCPEGATRYQSLIKLNRALGGADTK